MLDSPAGKLDIASIILYIGEIMNTVNGKIMRDSTQEDHKKLCKKYGQPVLFDDKDKCIGINQQYLAAEFAITHEPIYYLPEKCFYLYNRKNGTWSTVTEERLINSIGILIHNYAREYNDNKIDTYSNASVLTAILRLLKGQVENKDAFAKRKGTFVHCSNTMLEFNEKTYKWEKKDFSPHYYSRNQNPTHYNPDSKCPLFLNVLLSKAMEPDDIEHLQLYLGQCLIGVNLSQTFLLLIGTPGGGKSTLVNVIEGIVGRYNCTELRLEHMTGRFEISRTNGKTLLTGKDVNSEFMSGPGAGKLKTLTGADTMTAELKNSNEMFDIEGCFNIIITSNSNLRIKFDGDIEAWNRRVMIIKYEKSKTDKVIVNFAEKLLNEEGAGILNWALEGAAKLLKANGTITKSPRQEGLVKMLLQSSRSFEVFAEMFIHPVVDTTITTEEVVTTYIRFCEQLEWPSFTERKAQQALHKWMRSKFAAPLRTDIKRNGKNKRGYSGYQITPNN